MTFAWALAQTISVFVILGVVSGFMYGVSTSRFWVGFYGTVLTGSIFGIAAFWVASIWVQVP